MKTRRELLRVVLVVMTAAAAAVLLLIIVDYFKPATLQVDLNAPRFRLVRHRMILPDQEYELEWKHMSTWTFPPSETAPVFGRTLSGGRYAWEIGGLGMRFESIYRAAFEGASDEFLRTNIVVFQLNTRDMFDPDPRWRSAEHWATNR